MKKFVITIITVLITITVMAQSPEKMSYQAVIRNSSNQLVVDQSVGIRLSILQGSASGTIVYSETQFQSTNANGLLTLEFGSGSVISGNFSTINWGAGTYFLKTEIDPNGGSNYSINGTSQLLSVPYALHAKTAETVNINGNENAFQNWDKDATDDFTGNYNDLANKPTIPDPVDGDESAFNGWDKNATDDFSGDYDDLTNQPWMSNSDDVYSNSNVGIGTSSPSEKLDVVGNINITGMYKYSSSKTEYYHVGPSEFHKKESWAYHGDQEYAHPTTAGRAMATVHLPNGAKVTEVRVYYVDCSENNMTVYFRKTSSIGISRENIGSVTSTEYDNWQSPIARQMAFDLNETINNAKYRYTIIFETEQTNNNHRLYNIRIQYIIDHL